MQRYLDIASIVTIVATLALFAVALVSRGLTHDLLLEAGVFLVSAKLIIASYKSSLTAEATLSRLAQLENGLARLERLLAGGSGRGSDA